MLRRNEKNNLTLSASCRTGWPCGSGVCVSTRLARAANNSAKPATAIAVKVARQSKRSINRAPRLGAMTGAAVNSIVISDIRRTASAPDAMSRTIARDSTTADAAPKPCTNRAASMTSMDCAKDATVAAMANSETPAYSTGSRPSRSANSPEGIWPSAMPNMKMPTICCARGRSAASASAMAGIAGRDRSTVSAAVVVSIPSVSTNAGLRVRDDGGTLRGFLSGRALQHRHPSRRSKAIAPGRSAAAGAAG